MRDKIINQFFRHDFYKKQIHNAYKSSNFQYETNSISYVMFWFAVLDFYGGVYGVGKNGDVAKKWKGTHITYSLSNRNTFIDFVQNYFSPENRAYASLIYFIFRNGVMHQLSPKLAGLAWDEKSVLIFKDASGTLFINAKQLAEEAYKSVEKLETILINPSEYLEPAISYEQFVTSIYSTLKPGNFTFDGLGDKYVMQIELEKLAETPIPIITQGNISG